MPTRTNPRITTLDEHISSAEHLISVAEVLASAPETTDPTLFRAAENFISVAEAHISTAESVITTSEAQLDQLNGAMVAAEAAVSRVMTFVGPEDQVGNANARKPAKTAKRAKAR